MKTEIKTKAEKRQDLLDKQMIQGTAAELINKYDMVYLGGIAGKVVDMGIDKGGEYIHIMDYEYKWHKVYAKQTIIENQPISYFEHY